LKIKNVRTCFIILFPIAASWTFAAAFAGKCVGVHDGDSITVMKAGKAVKIRLEGIDCPEMGQDFGTRAKRFTSSLVFGRDVQVKEYSRDRYGRMVARVSVGGQDVSLEIIKAGLAWHYKKYSSDPTLAEAENRARNAKQGLWSMPSPVPPWEFRKMRRRGGQPDSGSPQEK